MKMTRGFRRPVRRKWSNETDYLLASPANARRLREALAASLAGGGIRFASVDDLRTELLLDGEQ